MMRVMRLGAPLFVAAGLLLGLVLCPGCHCKGHPDEAVATPSRRHPAELHPEIDPTTASSLRQDVAALEPIADRLGPVKVGDWLAEHDEPGQSFDEYVAGDPVIPDPEGGRRVIYVQPLGDLDETERRVVTLASDYLERFFGLTVQIEEGLGLDVVPERARRVHPDWGVPQISSSFVLDHVLRPRLPGDAASYISFTASDLWPGDGYNFVFGQASLRDRVGVWSMYRTGDPRQGEAAFRRVLWRTLKTAVHESAHMFSVEHCTAHECVMNGSNSLEESDARPMWLCPECMAKIAWATSQDPVTRYQRLLEFTSAQGLSRETAHFERAIDLLRHRHDHD